MHNKGETLRLIQAVRDTEGNNSAQWEGQLLHQYSVDGPLHQSSRDRRESRHFLYPRSSGYVPVLAVSCRIIPTDCPPAQRHDCMSRIRSKNTLPPGNPRPRPSRTELLQNLGRYAVVFHPTPRRKSEESSRPRCSCSPDTLTAPPLSQKTTAEVAAPLTTMTGAETRRKTTSAGHAVASTTPTNWL